MKLTVRVAMAAGLALALVGSAQANNLFGIDVSNWQGSINWSSVYGDGARFAFAKATEGNYYRDGYFNSNMNNGKAAGMQMGAYHFTRCDQNCASTEANYFWNFAGGKIIADGKSIYPTIDFEVFNGHACQPSYTAWFNAWANYVKGKTTHFLRPVIYASACTGMCDLTTACELSEWVANYNGQNLYTGGPWNTCKSCNYVHPGYSDGWTYWQVSSTGRISGVSGNCDFDAYNGTLAQLKTWQGVQ